MELYEDNVELVTLYGHDFYKINGRLIPAISGGAPDDDGDGDGDSDGDLKDESPITFGQLKELLQPVLAHIQEQGELLTTTQSNFDELVEALGQAMEEEEKEGDDDDDANEGLKQRAGDSDEIAALKRSLQKMETQHQELMRQIEEKEEVAGEERERRLASERDNLLSKALQEAGVLPSAIDAGVKLFRDNVVYDEDSGQFFFEEESTGVKLSVDEGIKDNLPDYLKATNIKQGGSGGRGSQASALLEKTRKDVQERMEKARKTGQEADIAAYHGAKKGLIQMENEYNSKGSTNKSDPNRRPAQVGRNVNQDDDAE